MTTTIAVIGGGIAGLCAAFDLHSAGHAVTVYEASDRFGGKVHSTKVGTRLVDAGADTFLARVPQGVQLCEDLGLQSELTSPVSPVPAYVHRDGKLYELPRGTVLGVPTDFEALRASGLISSDGVDRAEQDLELPSTAIGDDVSVGAYFRARLGDEVTNYLIDPMIGGINASDIDRLSLRAASPMLWDAATQSRSIVAALRKRTEQVGATLGSANANQPVFYGLPGGTARIIDRLVEELHGADLRLESPVEDVREIEADHIIIDTPAPATAAMLAWASPVAAELLTEVEYASVAQVTVEFPAASVKPILDASGILFPRVDGSVITASTWFSTKWAHYAGTPGPDETVLLRLTSGRYGDTRAVSLDDETLTSRLINDLRSVIQIDADPINTRVYRHLDALPQYVPGHTARVDAVLEAVKKDAPKIDLVGATYRGIGLPACIGSGREAAARILG